MRPSFPFLERKSTTTIREETQRSILIIERKKSYWSGRYDFFFTFLASAIGHGNFIVFPHLCFKYGGGIFFIPYIISLFCVSIPVAALEICLGQMSNGGVTGCWKMCRLFQNLWLIPFLTSLFISLTYNIMTAWGVWYLFACFYSQMPWLRCGEWSTPLCMDKLKSRTVGNCTAPLTASANGTCVDEETGKIIGIYNASLAKQHGIREVLPAEEYLNHVSLRISESSGIHAIGKPGGLMSVCWIFAWYLTFVCHLRIIKSAWKAVYVTVPCCYIGLVILMIRGLSLDGSGRGITTIMAPDVTQLLRPTVWVAAAVHAFLSLGPGFNALAALSIHNKEGYNFIRDTFCVALLDSLTSFIAGITLFSYVGIFSSKIGADVMEDVNYDVTMAFIIYPQALGSFKYATLWTSIFFIILIAMGLDSQIVLLHGIINVINEKFQIEKKYQLPVSLGCFSIYILIGLTLTTPGGLFIVILLNNYTFGWNVLVASMLGMIAIGIYGVNRFLQEIEIMVGANLFLWNLWKWLRWYFFICWCVLSPVCLLMLLVASTTPDHSRDRLRFHPKYANEAYSFPLWSQIFGNLLAVFTVVPFFGCQAYDIYKEEGFIKDRIIQLLKPCDQWNPPLPDDRHIRRIISWSGLKEEGLCHIPVSHETGAFKWHEKQKAEEEKTEKRKEREKEKKSKERESEKGKRMQRGKQEEKQGRLRSADVFKPALSRSKPDKSKRVTGNQKD